MMMMMMMMAGSIINQLRGSVGRSSLLIPPLLAVQADPWSAHSAAPLAWESLGKGSQGSWRLFSPVSPLQASLVAILKATAPHLDKALQMLLSFDPLSHSFSWISASVSCHLSWCLSYLRGARRCPSYMTSSLPRKAVGSFQDFTVGPVVLPLDAHGRAETVLMEVQ